MTKVFAESDVLMQLKKELHKQEEETFERNRVPYEQWSDIDKANQRYVDGIRNSCAELHEKYGDNDE